VWIERGTKGGRDREREVLRENERGADGLERESERCGETRMRRRGTQNPKCQYIYRPDRSPIWALVVGLGYIFQGASENGGIFVGPLIDFRRRAS
jgi:hypothetical protein